MPQSARQIDPNGFLLVKACPITRSGIFEYRAGDVGLSGDPDRIVNVYRPEYAVNNDVLIQSIKSIPLINDHTYLDGSEDGTATEGEGAAPEEVGIDGIVTDNVVFSDPWVRGDLKIFTRQMKELLDSGKVELSLGYTCDFKLQQGEFDGQTYEAVQDELFANHLALVDAARVGGARVLDCKLKAVAADGQGSNSSRAKFSIREVVDMAKGNKTAMDNAVQQLLGLIPALKEFLQQEANEPAHQDPASAQGAAPAEGDEGSDPAAQAGSEGGDPAANPAAEGGEANVAELVPLLKQVLAKLGGATADEGASNDPTKPNGDEDPENKTEDGDVEAGVEGVAGEKPAATPSADNEPHSEFEGNNGKASQGPSTATGDAAIRAVRADIAKASELYGRLSKVTGAFDASAMTHKDVASYGCRKLGLDSANPVASIEAYLKGVAQVQTQARAKTTAGDSRTVVADKATAEIDNFLNGSK